MAVLSSASALARACHPGPALAVTVLATAFAASAGHAAERVALITAAVLAGQLSIGWSNDLIDASRDRAVGRTDKPLATGEVSVSAVRIACALALATAVLLSLACGLVAGLIHLGCVAAGWAYNLGAKATVLSFVPYAVAFGGLPVFVALAGPNADPPPWWIPVAGALLGVGAHLLNVLPDLADDEATGVRGLPHLLGARWAPRAAVASLVAGTLTVAGGIAWGRNGNRAIPVSVLGLAILAVGTLAAVALFARGRVPFRAAIGIAAADVLLLVVAG